MSGPEYPRGPFAGDNAIGKFVIGESPIGSLRSFDVWTTVLSQYANSDVLMRLVTNFAGYVDQTSNLEAFFDLIWNVDTAQGYGLDVWGRIVGVGRILQVSVGKNLGFEEMGSLDADPFDQSPFYDGAALTQAYRLSDLAYRKLIFAKALANISDGSIPSINQILINLFNTPRRGNCYVTEGGADATWFGFAESITAEGFDQASFYAGQTLSNMTMTYTFHFKLTPVEAAIIEQSNVLPKSTGVKATVVQIY